MTQPSGTSMVSAGSSMPVAGAGGHGGVPVPHVTTSASVTPLAWDPFQLMDRLDEEALKLEMQGRVAEELVYSVKDGGTEVVGLSKVGVDECCMALVGQGQVIREEELEYEMRGEGENAEAVFKCKAARYAVASNGQEVKLDQVIGVKREPLYREAQTLDLDTKAPSKKYRGKTYRELLGFAEGRDYLAWMADNFNEPEIRKFVRRILDGEEVMAQRGRQLNPHWYESGAMKAARNARFRLIPAPVRAAVIAAARQEGKVKAIDASNGQPTVDQPAQQTNTQPAPAAGPNAPSDKQLAFYQRLCASPVFSEEERQRALEWLPKATRQTIKDQIDWLKRQVDSRMPSGQRQQQRDPDPRDEAMEEAMLHQNMREPGEES